MRFIFHVTLFYQMVFHILALHSHLTIPNYVRPGFPDFSNLNLGTLDKHIVNNILFLLETKLLHTFLVLLVTGPHNLHRLRPLRSNQRANSNHGR